MNKFQRTVTWLLCCLLLAFAPAYVVAQPSSKPGANNFVGPTSLTAGVTFAPTGSLSSGRHLHTATLLNNGKVLVAGGRDGGSVLNSAELYDPANGTWSETGSLSVDRRRHTATLLNNGKVLVTGGTDCSYSNVPIKSAELYDPATGIWSATGSLSTERSFHTATLLPNGKVLVSGGGGGGGQLDSAELYNPDQGIWSTTGSLSGTRGGHTATLLRNENQITCPFAERGIAR